MNAKGVDVSRWQTLWEWSTDGLSFVIAKASEGLTKDGMYQNHIAKGRAAGLIVGAYAFNRDDVNIADQAKFFADTAGDVDLYFIDVEGTHAFSQAQTKEFIAYFKAYTGKHIGLYHSASGFFDAGQDYNWVAHWGVTQPSIPWDFHQYRGSPLDLDQFNGDEVALKAFVANLKEEKMPTIVEYLPGYVATVGVGARIRTDTTLNATVIRTTTKNEKWTIVGWAAGEPFDGKSRWLCRWANNRWEFTHEVNVTVMPAEVPPTAAECQTFSDAAYAAGAASRDTEVANLTATVNLQAVTITAQNEQITTLNDTVNGLESEVLELQEINNDLNTTIVTQEGIISEAYDVLRAHPTVAALNILGGEA